MLGSIYKVPCREHCFQKLDETTKCDVNKLPAAIVISTTAFSSSVINRYRRNKYLIHIQHINKQHEIMQN